MTLGELLAYLEKAKAVASEKTCVSFECLCWGASSLWHQTHMENFRKVDRKPKELSAYVLKETGCVKDNFPSQILELLQQLKAEKKRLKNAQPKWVTGAEAREWPEGILILVNGKTTELPLVWRKTKGMYSDNSMRFLRLDTILVQEWPKDSQAEIDRRDLEAGNTPDRYGKGE
jgi:hypothetical protein